MPWLKSLEALSMDFRALQSSLWAHLPNLIPDYRGLPGGPSLWITVTFPLIIFVASYLNAFVYFGSFPYHFFSSLGSASASPAFRVLVEHDLLGKNYVLCSQSTACPLWVAPSQPAVEWSHWCLILTQLSFARMGEGDYLSLWLQLPVQGLAWRRCSVCTC